MSIREEDFKGEALSVIARQVEECQAAFDAGDLTADEYREILEDIKASGNIEQMSNNTVLSGQLLTGINAILKVI